MPSSWRAGVTLAAAVALTAAAAGAAAQTPLVDYETSARAAQVREGAAWRLAFRPGLQVLQQTVAQLRSTPGLSPDVLKQVDDLIAKAGGQPEPDARRTLWQAAALVNGRTWTPAEARLGSVALRSARPVWTSATETLDVQTLYPTDAPGAVGYQLNLYATEPTTSATPKKGALVKRVSAGTLATALPVSLEGVADGSYLLIAHLTDGDASTDVVQAVYVVRDLAGRAAAVRADLAAIKGHDEAKAIAEYPFALAEALNTGQREIVSYDFPAAVTRSQRIIAGLKAGRDEVRQATGLQNRAYRFAETGELVPYQVYVPSSWKPGAKLPLVVALHGANLDETNMLGRNGGDMMKKAEAHGFIVVTPLGYRLNSAYGSPRMAMLASDGGRRARSEADVLQVTALVEREYGTDPANRFLTGNSMGGGGTWWIGGQHHEMWRAIAPSAFGGVLPEDVPGLSKLPILAIVGDKDELGMADRVRASVDLLRKAGVKVDYIEVPGGTHAGAYERSVPDIFNFFQKHAK